MCIYIYIYIYSTPEVLFRMHPSTCKPSRFQKPRKPATMTPTPHTAKLYLKVADLAGVGFEH